MREILLIVGVVILAVATSQLIGSLNNKPQKAVQVDGKLVWK